MFFRKSRIIANMKELFPEENHIPHFLSESNAEAETKVKELISKGSKYGISSFTLEKTSEELMALASQFAPERVELVRQKREEAGQSPIESLSPSSLLDLLYGADCVITVSGKVYFVDATSGSSTSIKNKRAKMEELKELYRAAGADGGIVLNWKGDEPSEDDAKVLENSIKNSTSFISDIRFPSKEERIKINSKA